MTPWVAIVLTLTTSGYGHNGLEPRDLRLLVSSASTRLDETNPRFVHWLKAGGNPTLRKQRVESLVYFVQCAFDETFRLEVLGVELKGRYGLLGEGPLVTVPGHGRNRHAGGARKKISPARLAGEPGQWVSSCLLAHVNMKGSHEYIVLRGNPPGRAAQAEFQKSLADSSALGQPEGVFLADVFSGTTYEDEDLESFTLSLNLPAGYDPATAAWQPPNAKLGRTLDYHAETRDPDMPPGQAVLIAARIGMYHLAPGAFPDDPAALDPVYKSTRGCVGIQEDSGAPRPVSCAEPDARVLRPVFVLNPRMANFELASASDPGPLPSPLRVVVTKGRIDAAQRQGCSSCVGDHPQLWAGDDAASNWTPERPAGVLANLRAGQAVDLVYDLETSITPGQKGISAGRAKAVIAAPEGSPYTAVLRYACTAAKPCSATVAIGDEAQGQQRHWAPAGGYVWLRAYPVYPDKNKQLRIHVEGDGNAAPLLDAGAFLPGRADCSGEYQDSTSEGFKPPAGPVQKEWGVCTSSVTLLIAKLEAKPDRKAPAAHAK